MRAGHVDPSSPIPCTACDATCVVATEQVGWVYCACCGEDMDVSAEVWQLVHEKDIAYLDEQQALEDAAARDERTASQFAAWEAFAREH